MTPLILASLCCQRLPTRILVRSHGGLCFPKMAATVFPSHMLFLEPDFDIPPIKP